MRTCFTHYAKQSSELETYVEWYRDHEQPEMSYEEFPAADESSLELIDFGQHFDPPRL